MSEALSFFMLAALLFFLFRQEAFPLLDAIS